MPEGDTLFRTATRLRPALVDRTLIAARTNTQRIDAESLVNRRVTRVQSRGKHLLIHLDDGGAIHTHMGMTGSWHVYAKDVPWRKPSRNAAIVIETDQAHSVVCFTPKSIELLSRSGLRRHRWLNQLGPDILEDAPDVDSMIGRFRQRPSLPLGVALLDQRIVCGIGNIWKSELLFLEQLNPFQTVDQVTDSQLASTLTRGHEMMRRNVSGGPRRTRLRGDGQHKWVYRRSGQPCLKCGETIQMQRQGDLARSTYFCPECQA